MQVLGRGFRSRLTFYDLLSRYSEALPPSLVSLFSSPKEAVEVLLAALKFPPRPHINAAEATNAAETSAVLSSYSISTVASGVPLVAIAIQIPVCTPQLPFSSISCMTTARVHVSVLADSYKIGLSQLFLRQNGLERLDALLQQRPDQQYQQDYVSLATEMLQLRSLLRRQRLRRRLRGVVRVARYLKRQRGKAAKMALLLLLHVLLLMLLQLLSHFCSCCSAVVALLLLLYCCCCIWSLISFPRVPRALACRGNAAALVAAALCLARLCAVRVLLLRVAEARRTALRELATPLALTLRAAAEAAAEAAAARREKSLIRTHKAARLIQVSENTVQKTCSWLSTHLPVLLAAPVAKSLWTSRLYVAASYRTEWLCS